MTNTELIYNAMKKSNIEITEQEVEEVEGHCMMCGKKINEGTKYKKIVSGNFTDFDTFNNIQGTHICKECGVCVKTRELRTFNFIADEEQIYLFKKKELENMIMNIDNYVKGSFVIGLTRSFKKHNSYRTKVNTSTGKFYIREEDKEYLFDRLAAKELYKILNEMYLYFTKDDILTGNYNLMNMQEFGIDKFSKYESEVKKYRKTHQLDLLVYMLDSEKRNEIVQERIKVQKEEKARLKKLEKEKEKIEKKKQKDKESGQISLL